MSQLELTLTDHAYFYADSLGEKLVINYQHCID